MFNKRKIERLETRISLLESNLKYIEWHKQTTSALASAYSLRDITAREIVDRFDEIYRYLGVGRIYTSSSIKLVKQPTKIQ